MVSDSSGSDLQSILQAIKSSDVVESRVQLLKGLADLDISEKSDLISLAECLILALWEDFTCLDVSQCMLNKAILHVAAKYIDSNTSGCIGRFLILGTKASIWCGKHLKMTLMSTGDSQEEEEHANLFFQLLLNLLSFFTVSMSSLTRYPAPGDETLMAILEKFILEQLILTKDSVSEVKKIQSFGLEVLTTSQLVLDAVIELCRVYFQSVNLEVSDSKIERGSIGINCERADDGNHVINITRCAVEMLWELGVVAANNGGSLVTILNVSWKGVVNLLQLGKGALAATVNVSKIILTLVSLANESLRSAAKVWSSLLKEPLNSAEAKRTFVPTKFYLINAVRISLLYPSEAFSLYKEITLSVLMISSFSISLTKETLLRAASEVLVEFLEPTSFILFKTIFNSAEVKQETRSKILDWLFTDERNSISVNGEPICHERMVSMDAIFSVSCEAIQNSGVLLLGRVALFLHLLRSSCELEEDVRLGLSRKLDWFLNTLVDEEVYSSALILQIPILYGSGKSQELAWQPLFSLILHALRTFMIVVSSSLAWEEVMSFLLDNLFHPHFLCREIVLELWCFIARYAETATVNGIIDKLSLLLKSVASSESVLVPASALRTLARSICILLTYGSQSTVDRFYCSIINEEKNTVSSILHVTLLMEGFPLNLLTDNIKVKAAERIITDYLGFIESFDHKSLQACGTGLSGAPVFALSAALRHLQVKTSDIDMKTLKFLVAVINNYKNSLVDQMKDQCLKLLSETLAIISNSKQLYACDEMEEAVLELWKLFIPTSDNTKLELCKSELAFFMAGLVYMKMVESDTCLKSSAVWELYHMLLRERHWALAHLAITAFGYFAERTTCTELWRFVPPNAALSFDLDLGVEPKEERFMLEIKTFLDKEKALSTVTPSSEELGLLMKEGLMLKEIIQKIPTISLDVIECETVEVDGGKQANKRRKLPDGISQGMELLQSGLKVISDCLSQFDSAELHKKFSMQFSRLEDVIDHMAGLAGTR